MCAPVCIYTHINVILRIYIQIHVYIHIIPFFKNYGLIFIREIQNSFISKSFQTRYKCCKNQNPCHYSIRFTSDNKIQQEVRKLIFLEAFLIQEKGRIIHRVMLLWELMKGRKIVEDERVGQVGFISNQRMGAGNQGRILVPSCCANHHFRWWALGK